MRILILLLIAIIFETRAFKKVQLKSKSKTKYFYPVYTTPVVSRPYYPTVTVSPFVSRTYTSLPTYSINTPVVTATPFTRTVYLANKQEQNNTN